jgi:hydroxymethylbilane synthase
MNLLLLLQISLMNKSLRIGTRDSQLALWQASCVRDQVKRFGYDAELVFIKSEGDIDLQTPLYEIGVKGIFTRTLDMALLAGKIDVAVHSMKDVPTQLAAGIVQAAVLERASYMDILVHKGDAEFLNDPLSSAVIATSSIRRKAQWLNRFPEHVLENLRGNVNSRLRKLKDNDWNGAIFAAAGLERIGLRPEHSIDLGWMLPAPAQGAIMVVTKANDNFSLEATAKLNHAPTAICTKIERDFLRTLLGGCSTPISGLANLINDKIYFKGNIFTPDGKERKDIELESSIDMADDLGKNAALKILEQGGELIVSKFRNGD